MHLEEALAEHQAAPQLGLLPQPAEEGPGRAGGQSGEDAGERGEHLRTAFGLLLQPARPGVGVLESLRARFCCDPVARLYDAVAGTSRDQDGCSSCSNLCRVVARNETSSQLLSWNCPSMPNGMPGTDSFCLIGRRGWLPRPCHVAETTSVCQ